jgi:hypothetical protein
LLEHQTTSNQGETIMKTKCTTLKNNYTHKYLPRNLNNINAAIVLNDQKTVTHNGTTYQLDTHSTITLREAIDYIHDLANFFTIDKPISDSIACQLNIIFKRGYIAEVFNHSDYEAITLACLVCAYQLLGYPMDEARILAYVQTIFKKDVQDTIISEVNRCYTMLCGLHQIEPNNTLIMQFANYFNNPVLQKPLSLSIKNPIKK